MSRTRRVILRLIAVYFIWEALRLIAMPLVIWRAADRVRPYVVRGAVENLSKMREELKTSDRLAPSARSGLENEMRVLGDDVVAYGEGVFFPWWIFVPAVFIFYNGFLFFRSGRLIWRLKEEGRRSALKAVIVLPFSLALVTGVCFMSASYPVSVINKFLYFRSAIGGTEIGRVSLVNIAVSSDMAAPVLLGLTAGLVIPVLVVIYLVTRKWETE